MEHCRVVDRDSKDTDDGCWSAAIEQRRRRSCGLSDTGIGKVTDKSLQPKFAEQVSEARKGGVSGAGTTRE